MSLASAISEGISDRLNPIVIKELRQAVQSRFVTVAIMIFLGIQVLIMGAFIVFDRSMATDFSSGAEVFAVLQGILVATCILFVPAYTGIRLAAERSRVDLMFISAIKPWSIVRGKFLAAAILTLLLFAACMPFMTFTYLLRGIDLPWIFFALATGFLFVLASTQLAILWASIPSNLVIVILLGILLAIYLVVSAILSLIGGTIALVVASYGGVYSGVGSAMWTWDFWAQAGSTLLTGAMFVGLLMSLSVALLSPPSSNRMFQVRVYITIMWVLSAALAGVWAFATSSGEPIFAWCVWNVLLLLVAMLIAVSEREHWGPRVARRIPKNPLLRPWAFLFFTGWAGGVAWCVTLMALTLIGAAIVMHRTGFGVDWDNFAGVVGLALYAYAYPMTALLLRRVFFRNWIKCGLTWLIAVGLFVAATLLPILTFFMIHYDRMTSIDDGGIWLIGFPFMPFVGHDYLEKCLWFVGIWSAVVFVLSLPWAVGRYMAFKPYRITPPPVPQSAEPPGEQAPAAPD